jgi:hypothetical protein
LIGPVGTADGADYFGGSLKQGKCEDQPSLAEEEEDPYIGK